MCDQSNNQQSFEAENSKKIDEGADEQVTEMDDTGGGGGGGERREDEVAIGPKLRKSQPEALGTHASDYTAVRDVRFNSGHQLLEVPVEYALSPLEAVMGIKDRVNIKHQQRVVSVPGQAAQKESQNQMQSPNHPSSSDLSPTSVTQSITSNSRPRPTKRKQKSNVEMVHACLSLTDKRSPIHDKSLFVVPFLKKSSPDGYNWRKYGQKQVKTPQGSRSYYRCTYSDCCAKKIECSYHTKCDIETVYKSQHNHEPPHKVSCSPESRLPAAAASANGHNSTSCLVIGPNDPVQCSFLKDSIQAVASSSVTKEKSSSGSDENSEIYVKMDDIDEPEATKRLKKSSPECSGTLLKDGKQPKFVIHAAGDVGISGDGYRWRKYGQKMVKGNNHPRNYYRCTSAGCLVRKHIERAVDNSNAVTITYKGMHDHDMPVLKKRQGLPSAPLVVAAAPASMSNLQVKKCEQLQKQVSTTKWSMDKGGEMTSETPKAMDSAMTLLSIGFEIKPC